MRACSASICALDQATQGGSVGIVAAMKWYEPLTNTTDDILAARRAQAFETDWYVCRQSAQLSSQLPTTRNARNYVVRHYVVRLHEHYICQVSGADILRRLPRSDAGDPGIGPADLHRGGEGAAAAVQGGLHRAEPLHGDLRQGLPALPVQPRVVRRERLRLGDRGKGRRGQDRGRCTYVRNKLFQYCSYIYIYIYMHGEDFVARL